MYYLQRLNLLLHTMHYLFILKCLLPLDFGYTSMKCTSNAFQRPFESNQTVSHIIVSYIERNANDHRCNRIGWLGLVFFRNL